MKLASSFVFGVAAVACSAQEFHYQRPPEPIASVLNMPTPPTLSVSPSGDKALIIQRARYRTIAEMSRPMLALAGERINPLNNTQSRIGRITSLSIKDLRSGNEHAVPLPRESFLYGASWSPDGRKIVLSIAYPDSTALAILDADSSAPRPFQIRVNAASGSSYVWMPDSKTLLVKEVVKNRGPIPVGDAAPAGPEVQESLGSKRPVRTFPDALRDATGEKQFEYFMTSQLALVDTSNGHVREIGRPGILDAQPSPDGKVLLVTEIHRPFSHRFYMPGFPATASLWTIDGKVSKLTELPGEAGVPLDGVPEGPRDLHWRPDQPETLFWAEALDHGDPGKKVYSRDKLILEDVSTGQKRELMNLTDRYQGITWTEKGSKALVDEYDRDQERTRSYVVDLDGPAANPRRLYDISTREQYANPGAPVEHVLPNGHVAMVQSGDSVLFSGRGASADGDKPFLDKVDLSTLKVDRLWRCDNDSFESVTAAISPDGSTFVTRRESPTEPPNYFLHEASGAKQISNYANTYPDILKIKKQLVTYKRSDGVPLSFTLYLPPDYREGDKLPAIIEAYPLEFTDASTAGQVSGSTKTFPIIRGQLAFLLAGYAVMDNVAMPIVGTPQTVNDTFISQLVDDTKSAIDKANELGVIDTNRIGIMGHSYGAFMTANVLAHSDLVKAGAAESGAYNRSLTPFGFQSERRTYWQAQKMYQDVSPFSFADKLKHPILLIHGLQDDNPGTYTIQSQRFYDALAGNGGTVRLVLLPYEAHGYAAEETIEHVIWEELQWFDKYVKGAK
jgi:dipeptidyl aminopeptidase/acylaminoacyl peptidase